VLAFAVWTGEELIVVGGYDDDPCLPTRESNGVGGGAGNQSVAICFAIKSLARDGAAFDPDTGTWRLIATPPVPITRGAASAVVRDRVVYVVVAGQPGAFLAYHPGQDRWEELPPPGTRFGILIEAGHRLALFRNDDIDGNPDDWLKDPNREVAPGLLFGIRRTPPVPAPLEGRAVYGTPISRSGLPPKMFVAANSGHEKREAGDSASRSHDQGLPASEVAR
jgi:hypothetical protein